MKTPKLLTAVLLMIASVYVAPGAVAEDQNITVAFAYRPSDSGERIYADLKRTAHRACREHGMRSLRQRMLDNACTKEVMDKIVARMARSDISALHDGRRTDV